VLVLPTGASDGPFLLSFCYIWGHTTGQVLFGLKNKFLLRKPIHSAELKHKSGKKVRQNSHVGESLRDSQFSVSERPLLSGSTE